ncbi:hypothetical protein COO60DRAFT_416003 [Scenedesmus sp. NREL 46B-D3]|nr:hypothetical protein COO60DRAFT_416003 [Scenedesmus sp. NREL 46B-D3]
MCWLCRALGMWVMFKHNAALSSALNISFPSASVWGGADGIDAVAEMGDVTMLNMMMMMQAPPAHVHPPVVLRPHQLLVGPAATAAHPMPHPLHTSRCCVLYLMIFGAVLEDVEWCHRVLLLFLSSLGMCAMHANILEQCSLLFPPRWGAGPMALMLWLEWVI